VREVGDGPVVEFCRIEAEHRAECSVAVTEAAVAVGKGNAHWCLLDGIAE
jgi:hypothetical protein